MTVGEVATLETLDPDRIARPESLVTAVKRRFAGRYPVDPFGLDPQLADLVTPIFSFAVPVIVEGGQHVPAAGPATIVSNRGFGVIEPAALGVAVNRATGRRLRIVGAPSIPVLGSLARRLGGIGASANDVRAALRAGAVVMAPSCQRRALGGGQGETMTVWAALTPSTSSTSSGSVLRLTTASAIGPSVWCRAIEVTWPTTRSPARTSAPADGRA